jgi:hypothetical protein
MMFRTGDLLPTEDKVPTALMLALSMASRRFPTSATASTKGPSR